MGPEDVEDGLLFVRAPQRDFGWTQTKGAELRGLPVIRAVRSVPPGRFGNAFTVQHCRVSASRGALTPFVPPEGFVPEGNAHDLRFRVVCW